MGKEARRWRGGASRSNGARLVAMLGAIAVAATVACIGAGAANALTPINLQLSPGPGSISAAWGVSSTLGLRGFRVRWRRAYDGALWSAPVQLGARARRYVIEDLKPRAYQVRVRALGFEGLGGVIKDEAKALGAEEEPPTEEEPPVEEEEPPVGRRRTARRRRTAGRTGLVRRPRGSDPRRLGEHHGGTVA